MNDEMERMSPLDIVLLDAGKKAFLSDGGDAPTLTGDRICIWQLNELLAYAAAQPKTPLEIEGLPFDRLMLTHSPSYRRSRQIGDILGIKFWSRWTPVEKALRAFDPLDEGIHFSPIETSIREITLKPSSQEQVDSFHELKKFTIAHTHDLNELIMFRLLRPEKGEKEGPELRRFYFLLVESLCILMDIRLGEELGNISAPLKKLGVVYRDAKVILNGRPGDFDFECFVAVMLAELLQLYGHTRPEIQEILTRAGYRPRLENKTLTTNRFFFESLAPAWLKSHEEKYGGRLILPEPPRGREWQFGLRAATPVEFLHDRESLMKLYQWFSRVFMEPARG